MTHYFRFAMYSWAINRSAMPRSLSASGRMQTNDQLNLPGNMEIVFEGCSLILYRNSPIHAEPIRFNVRQTQGVDREIQS